MDNKTAKQIVNEALHIAITKGAFGLVEVTNVVKALEVLNAETPQADQDEVLTEYID